MASNPATSNLAYKNNFNIFLLFPSPKYALAGVEKKLYNQIPHVTNYALLVLESLVKNCGHLVRDEVATKSFMEQLQDLIKTTTHDQVRTEVLELIQAWAYALRTNPKCHAVQETVNAVKREGYKFPALKESDAMFSADTAPEWVDASVCHRCRVTFGFVERKHHCRACGNVFCNQCSSKTSTLPKFGIEKEVRVCEACYDLYNKPRSGSPHAKETESLSAEFVSSSLAQPSQNPIPKKSNEELKEEEDVQLALALSQSEAEAEAAYPLATNEDPDPLEYPICLANRREYVCIPCGHLLCGICKSELQENCFVCRGRILSTIRIYF